MKNYISHTMEVSDAKSRKLRKGLRLDGLNDFVETYTTSNPNPIYNTIWINKRFSISLWVWPYNYNTYGYDMVGYFMNDNQPIRSQPHSGPVPYTRLQFYFGYNANLITVQFAQTSNTNFVQTNIQRTYSPFDITDLPTNKLHHIVINYDGTNWTSGIEPTVEVYLNRRKLVKNNLNSIFLTTSTVPSVQQYNSGYYIGRFYNFLNAGGNVDTYHNIKLADYIIANDWFTPSEVSILYNKATNDLSEYSTQYTSSILSKRKYHYSFDTPSYIVTPSTINSIDLASTQNNEVLGQTTPQPRPDLVDLY